MENTRPGNHERAWNDPPLFDYQNTQKPTISGNKLNKRIGFPSDSSTNQASKTTSETTNSILNDAGAKPIFAGNDLPPLPPPPPSTETQQIVTSSEESTQCLESEVEVTDVIDILDRVMAKETLNPKKVTEIRKRIEIFRQKWDRDELNGKVKVGMHKLAKFLDSNEYDEAEKLQRSLNVDYPNLCTPWMIAIRQLILALKE